MRVIFGLVLYLSVIFACDQPYEEVFGFKIGCPLENKESFVVQARNEEGNITIYTKKLLGVFDTVRVIELNGNVEILELKIYENIHLSQHDINSLVTNVDHKWGQHKYQGPGVFFWIPKNNIISNIEVFSTYLDERNVLDLIYQSKKIVDFMKSEFKKEMHKSLKNCL